MSVARQLLRFYGQALAAAAAVAALGAAVSAELAGSPAAIAFGLGGAASLGGALAAGPALVRAGGSGGTGPWSALGWSTGLRFVGTIILASIAAAGGAARVPLLAGVVTTYGALLVLETRWALRRWNRPPAG